MGFYTQWYWKTDLHNLLHFLSLRADPHAQYEIRAYAEAMIGTVARWVPMAYAAFLEHRMNAAAISATGLAALLDDNPRRRTALSALAGDLVPDAGGHAAKHQ